MSKELLKEFSLGEQNPDVGGGIMYAFRYSREYLEAKKDQIAEIICLIPGVEITDMGNEGLSIDVQKVQEQTLKSLFGLLEEQTVVLDALFYVQLFEKIGVKTISDLESIVANGYASLRNENKVEIYNLVDIELGQILREIMIAQQQNGVLTSRQKQQLIEIYNFRSRFLKIAGSRSIILGR